MKRIVLCSAIVAAVTLACPDAATAEVVPFTETFAADAANWRDAPEQLLTFVASGGPDGSSFARGTFNFVDSEDGDGIAVFKGEQEFDSSGSAFVGDWIADNIIVLRASVRHNAPESLSAFVRLAPGFVNFPGAVGFGGDVAPNTWTELEFPISPSTLFFFEGSNFNSILSNVGNIQLGFSVPAALAGVDQAYNFDLDNVSVVPEPASAGLAFCAVLTLAAVARRRRNPANSLR